METGKNRVLTLCLLAAVAAGATVGPATHAADEKKKARCTQYAQRAVTQYQLMQSHPQCHVVDDMNWHGDFEGHFNGCMLIPEMMSRAGESMRDAQLQTCGGLSNAPSPDNSPAAQSTAPPPAAAVQSGATSNSIAQTPSNPSVPSASLPASGPASSAWTQPLKPVKSVGPPSNTPACKNIPAAPVLSLQPSDSGTGASLYGPYLSFTDSKTQQLLHYQVVRPMYLARQMACQSLQGDTGTWIWVAPKTHGVEFEVRLDGSVTSSLLNAAQVELLLK
jgi:hypothetical protein